MVRSTTVNAVGYIRMSSAGQEASPDQQRHEIEKLAVTHNYRIVRWYDRDLGISGDATEKRADFQQMVHDATEKRDFEVILVWDSDRFGRFDSIEMGYWVHPLRKAGVRLHSVCQGPIGWSDFSGRIVTAVQTEAKHQYLRDLSRNVLRGRLARARQGRWTGSRPAFGYDLRDGQLIVGDPAKVRAVRWIFKRYTELDVSVLDLAEELNAKSFPSPNGRVWQRSSVYHVLRNEVYVGRATQFRIQKGKYASIERGGIAEVAAHGAQARARHAPPSEWLTVPCPPLITQGQWKRAQEKLKKRRHRGTRKSRGGVALLSGLLVCSHCGRRMHSIETQRKLADGSESVITYACTTYNQQGTHGCYRNMVHERPLLDFVVPKLIELLSTAANAHRLEQEVNRQLRAREADRGDQLAAGYQGERRELNRLLAEKGKDIDLAVSRLKRVPDDLYSLAVDELRTLRQEHDVLKGQMRAAQTRSQKPKDNLDAKARHVLAGLTRLRERIQNADPAVAREALARVLERIDCTFEHQHHPKQTRSRFSKGVISFKVTQLSRLTSQPN
jgi:site-specific DNA recombinase